MNEYLVGITSETRSLFLHGEFPELTRVATHPTGTDLPVISKEACVARVCSPAFLGLLLSVETGLDTARVVSALCSGHLILLSQSRQSPGRFLWRGFYGHSSTRAGMTGWVNIRRSGMSCQAVYAASWSSNKTPSLLRISPASRRASSTSLSRPLKILRRQSRRVRSGLPSRSQVFMS